MDVRDELAFSPRRMQTKGEELANCISHALGLVAALIASTILLLTAFRHSRDGFFIGAIVFGGTVLFLYLASTLYHAWPQTRAKSFLRAVDHCAIFLLIAGTYTPFALGPLRALGGLQVLVIIWAVAIFGVIFKMTRGPARHPILSMSLYLGMGWVLPIMKHPLASALPMPAMIWLLAGGVAYTVGVLFFANERMRYAHFIWHLFVLAGTACHFTAVMICAS